MYALWKKSALGFLRLPDRPLDPPAGGYAHVAVFRASPKWLSYRLVLFWFACAIVAFTLFFAGIATLVSGQWWATVLVALGACVLSAVFVLTWFCVRIEYDLRTYVVTDRSLRVREGAWVFKEMTLTYANVQNVIVEQGPLQRLFGIEDLRVDTAGGGASGGKEGARDSGHSVVLAGLENAREVREMILAYVKLRTSGSGLGDNDDPDHAASARAATPEFLLALRGVQASTRALRTALERRTRPM